MTLALASAGLPYPHVLVSGRGEVRGPLNDTLARHGRVRRVGLVVPSFLLVPRPEPA